MARLAPKLDVLRALFSRSGNCCAFPGCSQRLINSKNQFIGQLCHIEAALPGGERFNPSQTDDERRAYDNLLLFCYPHHIETNDVSEFTVVVLKSIKRTHEAALGGDGFVIAESALSQIMSEMEVYWTEIERVNTLDHRFAELAFPINTRNSFFEILASCHNDLDGISYLHTRFRESDIALPSDFDAFLRLKGLDPQLFQDIPYYENPFQNRNWESHNLGIPNWTLRLKIDLLHVELKYLEEHLATNPEDEEARKRLERTKATFADLAQNALIAD